MKFIVNVLKVDYKYENKLPSKNLGTSIFGRTIIFPFTVRKEKNCMKYQKEILEIFNQIMAKSLILDISFFKILNKNFIKP